MLATAFLTAVGGVVVLGGGIAGYWGAYVSARSDRRLRQFLEAQVADIDATLVGAVVADEGAEDED